MKISIFITVISVFLTTQVYGISGNGISTYPLKRENRFISTEATSFLTGEGGVGIQARYTHKLEDRIIVDGGIGMSTGNVNNRIFGSAEYRLYSDYMNQPRVAFKVGGEFQKENIFNTLKFSATPIISKGLNFWEKPGYPYVSMPMSLVLIPQTNEYQTRVNLNAGVTGKLPIKAYEDLLATVEISVNFKDSYSGLFFGISYPLN